MLAELGYKIDEVHSDLSPEKKNLSNAVLSNCIGHIESNGFTSQYKPRSFAASGAADRHTK